MQRIGFIQPKLIGFGGVEMYGMHVVQALSRQHSVDVITAHPVDRQKLETAFDLDLSSANFRVDPRCTVRLDLPRMKRWRAQSDLSRLLKEYPLTILNNFELPDVCRSRLGILLNHSAVTSSLKLKQEKPGFLGRLTSEGRAQLEIRHRVTSWTQVVTNSQFTRQSFHRLWQRDSTVIYPPIPVSEALNESAKSNLIVGCGFFSGLRDESQRPVCGIKRQDLLIKAFKQLVEQGIADAELVLTGHYEESELNSIALRDLRALAENLPVRFLLNVPHADLTGIFKKARLFWQATGFGRDPLEQVGMMETFGMAMVEAMSQGCVPLAFAAGGAPEVVGPVDSALLWNTLDELAQQSLRLLNDERRFSSLSKLAQQRAGEFSESRFADAWVRQVTEVLQ